MLAESSWNVCRILQRGQAQVRPAGGTLTQRLSYRPVILIFRRDPCSVMRMGLLIEIIDAVYSYPESFC